MMSEFLLRPFFLFNFNRNISYSNPFFVHLVSGFRNLYCFLFISCSMAIKLITLLIQISTFIHRIGRTFKYLRSSRFEFEISLSFPFFVCIFYGLVKFMRKIVKPFWRHCYPFQVSRLFFCEFPLISPIFCRVFLPDKRSAICLSFLFFCPAFFLVSLVCV